MYYYWRSHLTAWCFNEMMYWLSSPYLSPTMFTPRSLLSTLYYYHYCCYYYLFYASDLVDYFIFKKQTKTKQNKTDTLSKTNIIIKMSHHLFYQIPSSEPRDTIARFRSRPDDSVLCAILGNKTLDNIVPNHPFLRAFCINCHVIGFHDCKKSARKRKVNILVSFINEGYKIKRYIGATLEDIETI